MEEQESGPAGPARRLPEFGLLWRGAVFAAGAVVAGTGAGRALAGPWATKPLAPVLALTAVLAAWAAAVHLTGGEEFDDMPWV